MLRILHITEASAAGVGRHLMDLIQGLHVAGCESHLIYSTARTDKAFFDFLNRLPELPATPILMRRAPHVSDVGVWRRARAYIEQHGPFDIIHAHSTKGGIIARTLPTMRAKVVYTPHCIYTMNPTAKRPIYHAARVLEKRLARRTDAIVAVSPDEREHIVSLGIQSDKVHCIVNGVTPQPWLDKSAARRRLGLPESAVMIGYLGRLVAQKNPLLFVEACSTVMQRHREVHAAVVGSGPLEAAARALADRLGAADRFHWVKYEPADVAMPAFDVFALSSWYEGMPYTLIEAIAAGLPVVSTEVGGARLTIADGESGYVTPVGDVEAFARRLEELAIDAPRRGRFAAASRAKGCEFTAMRMVEETLNLYRQLSGCSVLPSAPIGSAALAGSFSAD